VAADLIEVLGLSGVSRRCYSSLLEAVLLPEDSRGAIKNVLHLPSPFPDLFHKLDPKNAFVLAHVFLLWYEFKYLRDKRDPIGVEDKQKRKDFEDYRQKDRDNADDIAREFLLEPWFEGAYRNEERSGKKLVDLLKEKPGIAKKIKNLKDWEQYVDFMLDIKHMKSSKELESEALMKTSDGMYWIDIGASKCGREARLMGHCGNDNRGDLVSLRDKNNKPHVTMTWNKDDNTIYQIKGKQNDVPDKKYWPAVKEFFNRFKPDLRDYEIIDPGDEYDRRSADQENFADYIVNGEDAVQKKFQIMGQWWFKDDGRDNLIDASGARILSLHNGSRQIDFTLSYDPKKKILYDISDSPYKPGLTWDDEHMYLLKKFLEDEKSTTIAYNTFSVKSDKLVNWFDKLHNRGIVK